MRIFSSCSFWRCLGSDARVGVNDGSARPSGKDPTQDNALALAGGIKSVKGSSLDLGNGHDSAGSHKAVSGSGSKVEARADDGGAPGLALPTDLSRQERTLRALLQKAKMVLAQQSQQQLQQQQQQSQQQQQGEGSLTRHLGDPELARLNKQLLEASAAPRPDSRTLLRVELLLADLRRWLCAAGPSPAAATALLYVAGEALAHAEHCVRSVGQVRFWQPDGVAAFLALLQLHGDLLAQAGRAAQLHRQQLQQREREREREMILTTGGEGSLRDEAVEQQHQQQGKGKQQRQQQQHPLAFAAAALLLRPDWLDVLMETLELLHFSDDYVAAASAAGRAPQEALAAALQLWGFLTALVKFAAAHAEVGQRMAACLARLAALLSPPSGTVPRLLAMPLREDTLVAQLHALWLLQVLYDMPDAKVLYEPALADHYVALHHNALVAAYQASAADPKSASAELCRIHATLLRSLARHPGQPVRAAFARSRTVEWLLGEMSLESQLLPQAAAEGAGGDGQGGHGDDDDDSESLLDSDDEDLESSGASSSRSAEGKQRRGAGADIGKGGAEMETGDAFAFTYDLNEDVERLIALEDALGKEVALDGFEYDEEGRALMAESEARQVAAAAVAAVSTAPPAAASGPNNVATGKEGGGSGGGGGGGSDGIFSSRTDMSFYGGGGTSRRSGGGVPRLALAGLRCASVSSMHGASVRSATGGGGAAQGGGGGGGGSATGGGRRSMNPVGRVSQADSMWGATSTFLENDDDDWDAPLAEGDGPSTPVVDPVAAAERIARWSTTVVDIPAGPLAPPPMDVASPSMAAAAAAYGAASGGAGGGGSTRSTTVHPGPQGELHILAPGSASRHSLLPSVAQSPAAAAPAGSGRGLPPLSSRPVIPPLRIAASGDGLPPSSSTSARQPPQGSSRALVLMCASNRANAGVWQGASGNSGSSPAPPPLASPASSDANRSTLQAFSSVRLQAASAAAAGDATSTVTSGGGGGGRGPLIPALNLNSLRRRDGGGGGGAPTSASDTGRTVPLISMLRANPGGIPHGSAMDSSATPPTTAGGAATRSSAGPSAGPSASGEAPTSSSHPTPVSSTALAAGLGHMAGSSAVSGRLQRIPETTADGVASPRSPLLSSGDVAGPLTVQAPAAAYQELACGRLLYQDPGTHLLLLKILMDLLITPAGALDPAYVSQHPADAGLSHAEYVLLWHLNAPRNGGVVHELCRGAQRRALQTTASSASSTASSSAATASAAGPAASRSSSACSSLLAAMAAATSAPTSLSASVAKDSARDHPHRASWGQGQAQQPQISTSTTPSVTRPPSAATAAATTAPAMATVLACRPCGVTRALQLLSRPLFDSSRYSNLQFMARGAYGNIFRARMDPPSAAAAMPAPAPAAGQSGSSTAVTAPASAAAASSTAGTGPGSLVGAGSGGAAAAAAASGPLQVVIKTIQLPGSSFDGCVLGDVFGEVAIMERFKGHDCICQMLDYGMHDDAYWIVMRRYRCSLAEWRARQRPLGDAAAAVATAASGTTSAAAASGSAAAAAATPDSVAAAAATAAAAARVYLSALAQVVEGLSLLASHNVVHFDLKCANVLIEPLGGVRDGELWAPVGVPPAAGNSEPAGGAAAGTGVAAVPFRCVLADFGEARAYRSAAEAFTARNRGTEVFKSPEMLMLNATGGRPQQLPAAPVATTAASASPQQTLLAPSASAGRAQPPPLNLPLSPATKYPSFGAAAIASSASPAAHLGRSPSRPTSARHAAHPPQQSLAGAGLASDVWSLGCLAFELLSGSVLFGGDYASVTHRVAFGSGERLVLTEAERARLGGLPQLVGLVEWILVRDPARRPSLAAIRDRVEQTREALAAVASCSVAVA